MNRKEQQAELIYALGSLLRPLQDVVDDPEDNDAQARARASAKFVHDADDFLDRLDRLASGEPGHRYEIECVR